MTETLFSASEPSAASPARDLPDLVRLSYLTFVVVALLNHAWFTDLSDLAPLDAVEGGSLATQLLFGSMILVGIPMVWHLGLARLRPVLSRPALLFGLWLLATTLLSGDLALSLRRLALYGIAAFLAASLLVVARSARQLADAFAMAGFTVLVSSYLGLLIVPALTIHSHYDLTGEIGHDGLWRGIFSHKNEAGMAMTILVILGLFIASVRSRLLGWTMVAASGVFLVGSGSKTPLITLAMVLGISWLCRVIHSRAVRVLVLVGPVLLLITITIGSIVVPPVRSVLDVVLPDATFTARNEIWSFAIDNIVQKPLTGFGFGAFWLTERTVYASIVNPDTTWVQMATQAHNSFLDAALAMGLPGFVLTLLVFIAIPTRDFLYRLPQGATDPSAVLFMRLWQLVLLSASFETILFNPNTPAFGMIVMAISGLRMLTVRPVIA
ncbi:O-antigen ligase family protein [Methylobacterium sp. J-076]|uniref:O-antigen ligase family protein n=1 Tax=Methylobacterium sp. J-076 TaxID=2836655 RepID=UPI001FB9363C|nr:O-antigen ligase [Methylobacterium sp. J-076]MCJ2015743.1 O-antigen ligase family protein [Methylobacterium sp. J-076]